MRKYKTIIVTSAYIQYIRIIKGVEGFKNVLSLVIQKYHITSTLTYPNKSNNIKIYICDIYIYISRKLCFMLYFYC